MRSAQFHFTVASLLLLLLRFQGGKRDELIGITYNRLIRMDASTGDAIKTWRFSNMKQWNVNWEIKMVGSTLNRNTFIKWDFFQYSKRVFDLLSLKGFLVDVFVRADEWI